MRWSSRRLLGAMAVLCATAFSHRSEHPAHIWDAATSTLRLRGGGMRSGHRGRGRGSRGGRRGGGSAASDPHMQSVNIENFQEDVGAGRKLSRDRRRDAELQEWTRDDPFNRPYDERYALDNSMHPLNRMAALDRIERMKKRIERRKKGTRRRLAIAKREAARSQRLGARAAMAATDAGRNGDVAAQQQRQLAADTADTAAKEKQGQKEPHVPRAPTAAQLDAAREARTEILQLTRNKRWSEAAVRLDEFERLAGADGLPRDRALCAVAVNTMARLHQPSAAKRYLKRLAPLGAPPPRAAQGALLKAYCLTQHLAPALQLLREMVGARRKGKGKGEDASGTERHLSTILRACVRTGNMKVGVEALELFGARWLVDEVSLFAGALASVLTVWREAMAVAGPGELVALPKRGSRRQS